MRLETQALMLLLAHRAPFTLHPSSATRPGIVTFSGTHNWRDVRDDVDVRTCPWWDDGGKVHCGMFSRTLRMWDDVETFCHDERSSLVLAGYSLGGGVSMLLASMLARQGVDVQGVYTFGAPRVGDTEFAKWYAACGLGDRTRTYVTPRDPVPLLPPNWPTVGRRILVPCDASNGPIAQHDLRLYLRGVHALRQTGTFDP
jgi:pimeloyl-ACP methyl ester carboxylesterase